MEHRDIVLGLLTPTNENAPETIHPTMRPLHDIPTRLAPRPPFHGLRLLAAAGDVRREAKLRQNLPSAKGKGGAQEP